MNKDEKEFKKSSPLSEKAERNFAKIAYKINKRLAEEKAKEENKHPDNT